jgi:hypothetical protein
MTLIELLVLLALGALVGAAIGAVVGAFTKVGAAIGALQGTGLGCVAVLALLCVGILLAIRREKK